MNIKGNSKVKKQKSAKKQNTLIPDLCQNDFTKKVQCYSKRS